jgi:hypothetical protein
MPIRQAFGASAALALLVGCSAGTSQLNPSSFGQAAGAGAQATRQQTQSAARTDNSLLPPGVTRMVRAPITTPSFMDPHALGTKLVFVSDAPDGVVDIYPQSGKTQKMVGQITGLKQPQGLTTDAQGNLYVANTNDSNVLVYAPPYTGSPAVTLNDSGEFPVDVAVSSAGVVAVTNICSAPHCRADTASVNIYAQGSTTPCATLSDDQLGIFNLVRVNFAGFDAAGNLYVDGNDPYNEASFGFIQGGCQATTIAHIAPSATFSFFFPGSIAVTKAGLVAIIDLEQEAIATFAAPVGGTFGNPVAVTYVTGSGDAAAFALLASGKDLYTADSSGTGSSAEYAYTAGGAAKKSIAVGGQPIGVAVTPAYLP